MLRALRVLDANANRATEGLRTIEDYARLIMQDDKSARQMKYLRHQLAGILQQVSRRQRLQVRSTETDAGTETLAKTELARPTEKAIVAAAAERVTQSMRCLEEYSKLISSEMSSQFKQLRYAAYDILAKTELHLTGEGLVDSCQLYLLIDCSKPTDQFVSYIASLAAAGVDWFQLRDKHVDGAVLVRYGRAAVEALAGTGSKLIINDRVDVALACNAAGVHLGQEDMSLVDARRLAGNRLAIGISTHNVEQAIAAERAGADCIGCGPTFPSTTKSFEEFSGTCFITQVAQSVAIPFFAIGGITSENLPQVMAAGGKRIAVSGAIHAAGDPVHEASQLKMILAGKPTQAGVR